MARTAPAFSDIDNVVARSVRRCASTATLAWFVAAVVTAGCSDAPTGRGARPDASRPRQLTRIATARALLQRPHPGGVEQWFAQIADSVPGFAGFYYDTPERGGQLVVRVVAPSIAEDASARVRAVFAEHGRPVAGITTLGARYSFLELSSWRDSIFHNLPAGTWSLDVNEVSNLVDVGVENAGAAHRVQELALRAGIPESALNRFITPRPAFRSTLSDQQRPVMGGLEVAWTQGDICTIGVNGRWLGLAPYSGFTTASHCSQVYMGLDAPTTNYFQPAAQVGSNQVGYEFDDPSWLTAPCPLGTHCRWSDLLFVRYDPVDLAAYGKIARTSYAARGARGSTTIVDQFTIVGTWPSSIVGEELQKVGRTSGWTSGTTTATCVDKFTGEYDSTFTPLWLLCSDITDLWSEAGDSGAPVFKWFGGADTTVYWAGSLWGGPLFVSNESWHSPWNGIATEMVLYQWFPF